MKSNKLIKNCIFILLLILISCSVNDINCPDGYLTPPSTIGFYKYYTRLSYDSNYQYKTLGIIDTLNMTDTLFVSLGEYRQICPDDIQIKSRYRNISVATKYGDKETFQLEKDDNSISPGGNITFYRKQIDYSFYSASSINPNQGNNIIDLNEKGDLVIATYSSLWDNQIINDTLIFIKGEK